jgi:stearoyl-CoA desaturase (delta-9 desaturase)
VDTASTQLLQTKPGAQPVWRIYLKANAILFAVVHFTALAGVLLSGWSSQGFALAVAVYYVRMVVVTAGYHRYFSHRSFHTSRVFQFLLALGAQSAAQKGVLWWASHHRWHHKYSDTERDVHSPKQRGFWYAHIGWIFSDAWNTTDPRLVPDLYKYPELRWLDKDGYQLLPSFALGLAFLLVGGTFGLVWGFMVSTVLLWHGSFAINSLTHLFGKRRYATSDDSRNSWVLAILTTGEGWHNNHHHYPSSAGQGFFWWEIDLTYYVLRLLAMLGLVWDLRRAPDDVLAGPLARRTRAEPAGFAGSEASREGLGTLPGFPLH